jgi:hypothetical protein
MLRSPMASSFTLRKDMLCNQFEQKSFVEPSDFWPSVQTNPNGFYEFIELSAEREVRAVLRSLCAFKACAKVAIFRVKRRCVGVLSHRCEFFEISSSELLVKSVVNLI